jgi:hypothetical protein
MSEENCQTKPRSLLFCALDPMIPANYTAANAVSRGLRTWWIREKPSKDMTYEDRKV